MARQEQVVTHRVDSGEVRLRRDPAGRSAWTLEVDGRPQSHVDLDDPRRLVFDYIARMAQVVDCCVPDARDVVHLGFGAGTLARWLAATRPGARQRAFELDGALVELVRRELPLPSGLRVGAVDAAGGVRSLRDASTDLVVADVFADGRTPEHLRSDGFLRDVRRVLRAEAPYLVNLAHDVPEQTGVLKRVWAHVTLVGDEAVLLRRREGNLVALCSDAVPDLRALQRAVGSVTRVQPT